MSYILDALKRSEQEEKIRQTPALDTVHSFSAKRTTNPAMIILLVSLFVLAASAAFYLYLQNKQRSELIIPEITSQVGAKISAPAAQTEIIKKVVTVGPGLAPRNIEAEINAAAVQIRDLPYSVQQEIPEMRFSSHIFAEDPSLRLVNINGSNIREGSHVTKGIRLLEITEEGVLLRYQNYTFKMSVLRDWTFD
jgi:general secretion pathway protein B